MTPHEIIEGFQIRRADRLQDFGYLTKSAPKEIPPRETPPTALKCDRMPLLLRSMIRYLQQGLLRQKHVHDMFLTIVDFAKHSIILFFTSTEHFFLWDDSYSIVSMTNRCCTATRLMVTFRNPTVILIKRKVLHF